MNKLMPPKKNKTSFTLYEYANAFNLSRMKSKKKTEVFHIQHTNPTNDYESFQRDWLEIKKDFESAIEEFEKKYNL